MTEKKKFRDTKVGKFLKDKAPKVLDVVGDLLPDKGVLGIVKNLLDTDEAITPEDREHALKLLEKEIEAEREISERWKADMASDSFLSKNSRPIVLLYSWLLITIITVAAFFKVELPIPYIGLIEALAIAVNVAYFGSRGMEKWQTIKNKG